MVKTVVGLFETQAAAEQAVNALIAHGFTNDQIGVSLRGETRAASASANDPLLAETQQDSDTDKGATAGLLAGATIGGTLGVLLAGASTVIFPGVGALIAAGAAGQIATTVGGGLAGAGLGVGVGSLTGGMSQQNTSDEHVDVYADVLQYGGVIVTVDTEEQREQDVAAMFQQAGAIDLTQRRAARDLSANEAAVREADALDMPAVDQIANVINNGEPAASQSVETPTSDALLASAQAVANTQPSGLASFKPGEANASPEMTTPTTQTTVGATTVTPGVEHSASTQLPYEQHEPYLTADLNATGDLQLQPLNAFGEYGAHDEIVGTHIPGTSRRRSRVYGMNHMSVDPITDARAERDLTVGEQFGGAMDTPEGPITTDRFVDHHTDTH